jgi:hypothetical protein
MARAAVGDDRYTVEANLLAVLYQLPKQISIWLQKRFTAGEIHLLGSVQPTQREDLLQVGQWKCERGLGGVETEFALKVTFAREVYINSSAL